MPSNSKEYAKKYYEENKQKMKQYYKDNKEQFKINYQNSKNKLVDVNTEHYKIFLDYLKLLSNKIEDNIYYINAKIYENDLVKKYINDNIDIFKEHFYYNNWYNLLKTKKLANQLLKRMCKVLNIEHNTIIKPNSHTIILICL